MPDRRLTIEMELKRQQATASAKAMVRELDAVRKAAERAEKAMSRVGGPGAGSAAGVGSGSARGQSPSVVASREAARYQREIEKAGRLELRTRVRNHDQVLREQARADAARIRAQERAERQYQREVEKSLRNELRARARAAEQAQREQDRANRARARAEEQAGRRELRERVRRYDAMRKAASDADEAAWGVTRRIGGFAAGLVGIGSAAAAIGTVTDYIKTADAAVRTAITNTREYRERLAELGMLRGLTGKSDKQLRDEINLRLKTRQTADEARQFQEAALGVGESAIGLNITKEEFEKLMVMGGSFQAAQGGESAAHGSLVGQIPMLLGRQTDAAEAFRTEQQLYSIFQPGGSTFTSGVNQFLKNAPLVQNEIMGLTEMAALQSAFSLGNKEGAGELVEQFTRATIGGLGRGRGMTMMEGVDEDLVRKQGEYLRDVGATDQMSPVAIGKLIAEDFARQEAAAAAKGQQFNAMNYLLYQGFGNMQDRQALMAFAALQQSGQFGKFEALAAPGALPSMETATRQIREFHADPRAAARMSEVITDAGQIGLGAGPGEYYQDLFTRTFAEMQAAGEITGSVEDYRGAGISNPRAYWQRKRIEEQMAIFLEKQRAQAGLGFFRGGGAFDPFTGNAVFTRDEYGEFTESGRAQNFFASAQELAQAIAISGGTGSVLPAGEAVVEAMNRNTAASEQLTEAIGKISALPPEFGIDVDGKPNAAPPKGPLPAPGKPQVGAAP